MGRILGLFMTSLALAVAGCAGSGSSNSAASDEAVQQAADAAAAAVKAGEEAQAEAEKVVAEAVDGAAEAVAAAETAIADAGAAAEAAVGEAAAVAVAVAAAAGDPATEAAAAAAAGDASKAAAKMFTIPDGAGVSFVEPANGSKVTSPVRVVMELINMAAVPAGMRQAGTGHHHLIIDGQALDMGTPVPKDARHIHYGNGQTEATVDLEPGKHTLTLQFADWDHRSYGPSLASSITVTVVAGE